MSNAREITRRSFLASAAIASVGITTAAKMAGGQSLSKVYEFVNGRWFEGKEFKHRRFYSVNGVFRSEKPARIDSVIDLTGKYVIPPFAEAHNHNIESSGRIDEVIREYLQAGIFYVKNPNNLPTAKTSLSGKINIPTSVDVTFANGGLTGSGGHPFGIVKRSLERGESPEIWAEGSFYFSIDSIADLDRKWDRVLAGKPDFIKTYLQYSEEYEKRKADDAYLD